MSTQELSNGVSYMRRYRKSSDSGDTAIALALIAIVAMPIFGIYLLTRNNETDKTWGAILTVLGIILWIAVGVMSA